MVVIVLLVLMVMLVTVMNMMMMVVAVVVIVLPRPWLESEEAFAKRLHLTFTSQLQMEQQLIPTVPMVMMMKTVAQR